MRSAPTLTNRRLKLPPPRLLRFLTRRCATPRWSPSASQPQDTDTTVTDTTTARRLPRRLATMSLLLPLLSLQLRLKRSASPSLLLLLARLLISLSPSRSARRSTTDMLRMFMRLSQSLLPLLSQSSTLQPLLLMPLSDGKSWADLYFYLLDIYCNKS